MRSVCIGGLSGRRINQCPSQGLRNERSGNLPRPHLREVFDQLSRSAADVRRRSEPEIGKGLSPLCPRLVPRQERRRNGRCRVRCWEASPSFQERGYRNVRGVVVSPEQVQISRQVVPDVAEENALEFLETFDLITGLDII